MLGQRASAAKGDRHTQGEELDTYRPLTMATFFWDSAWSGRDTWSYHLTNLVLHTLVVLLLFFAARRLLSEARRPWALFAAAWVGLQPVAAEAHVWINGRSDLCAAIFLLASLWLFLATRTTPSAWRSAMAGLCFLLACLAKEVVLPAAFVMLAWHIGMLARPVRQWRISPALRSWWPVAAAVVVYFALRLAALDALATGNKTNLAGALGRLSLLWLEGLRQILMPEAVSMRVFADETAHVSTLVRVLAWVAVIVIAVFTWRVRTQAPLVALGLAWFAALSAPASLITWPGFGRYFYLPMLLLAVAAADLLARVQERTSRPWLVAAAAGVYLAASALLLQVTIETYRTEETFYSAAIEDSPDSALGYRGLGRVRADERSYDEAIELLSYAYGIDQAQDTALNLGLALVMSGRGEEGYELAVKALSMNPKRPGDFYNIAVLATMNRDVEKTAKLLLEGLDAEPGHRALERNLRALSTRHSARVRYRLVFDRLTASGRYARFRSLLP